MDEIICDGRKYTTMQHNLGNLNLIIIKAKNGYVACSYIDRETAEKVGDVAAFVSGVKTIDEFLKAKVKATTTWAENIGIREGMSVKKALELMDTFEKV